MADFLEVVAIGKVLEFTVEMLRRAQLEGTSS